MNPPPTDAAKLLAVACAHPLSVPQLVERADLRFGVLKSRPHAARVAVQRLRARGWLAVAVQGTPGGNHTDLSRYVLTPAGEDALDARYQRGQP